MRTFYLTVLIIIIINTIILNFWIFKGRLKINIGSLNTTDLIIETRKTLKNEYKGLSIPNLVLKYFFVLIGDNLPLNEGMKTSFFHVAKFLFRLLILGESLSSK